MSPKKLAIIGSILISFLLILVVLLLSAKPIQKITVEDKIPPRLTATPFVAKGPSVTQIPTPSDRLSTLAPTPTLIMVSPTSVATPSSTPQSEKKLGRLSYFSESLLQNTDLSMTQTLAGQISTEAGNLKWSPKGTYLSWVTPQGDKGSQISYIDPLSNQKKDILFEGASFIDYVWSSDESKIAILYGEGIQTIAQISVKTGEKLIQNLMILPNPADNLFWLRDGTLLISGKKGIYDYDETTKEWNPVVVSDSFVGMKLSPDEKTIAYAILTGDKIDWFLLPRDTNAPEAISLNETTSDLSQVQLPFSALEKGYDTKIAWYPDSSRLLISV
jgi:hypothetical protein